MRKYTLKTYPHGVADTEERTQFPSSGYNPKWCYADVEETNCWIKFVFFAYKKYSRSFVKLRLNPWCHMDYFTDLFTTFLNLDRVWTLAVYAGSESSQVPSKYLNLCSEDERRSYGFETTSGWVINDRIFIFGWTNPLSHLIIVMWPTTLYSFTHLQRQQFSHSKNTAYFHTRILLLLLLQKIFYKKGVNSKSSFNPGLQYLQKY